MSVSNIQRYIRVRGTLHNKYVEFDFSMGDPNLFVELVLPFDQFHDFCQKNEIQQLCEEQGAAVDKDQLKWRFGE